VSNFLDHRALTHDRVLIVPRISLAALQAVTSGDALAFIVPQYYTTADCALFTRRLLSFDRWTSYETGTGAEAIGTLGSSLFGCLGQEFCESYFDGAAEMMAAISDHFSPFAYPIDRVIRELDLVWPHGASLWRVNGRVCFAGLARMFRSGGAALPHDDRADIDFPAEETSASLDQLFINVYCSKTVGGGKLQIWDRRITDRAEYDRLRDGDSYGLCRDVLGEPEVTIDPPLGGLLIGSARRIHAVTACEGEGVRLSVSSFIQYAGDNRPLFVHS